MRYIATTVDGERLPVEIKGQYPRRTGAGFDQTLIGVVQRRTPHGPVSKVIFFDKWGEMFWAGNILDDYIEDVNPDRSGLIDIGFTRSGEWVA